MPISPRGVFAQRVLVSFNALLSAYSLAVVVATFLRPCQASQLSTDPSEFAAAKICSISQLQLFMLVFHLAIAVLAMIGAAVAYVGHIVLVRITRGMLIVFAAIYLGLAIYQLAMVKPVTLLGPLELTVAILAIAVGVPSGAVYERELRCDRRVVPDAFDSVLPPLRSSSSTSSSRRLDRRSNRLAG